MDLIYIRVYNCIRKPRACGAGAASPAWRGRTCSQARVAAALPLWGSRAVPVLRVDAAVKRTRLPVAGKRQQLVAGEHAIGMLREHREQIELARRQRHFFSIRCDQPAVGQKWRPTLTLKPDLAVRTKANQLQHSGTGLPVDQQEVGLDMAISMVFPTPRSAGGRIDRAAAECPLPITSILRTAASRCPDVSASL